MKMFYGLPIRIVQYAQGILSMVNLQHRILIQRYLLVTILKIKQEFYRQFQGKRRESYCLRLRKKNK